MTYIDTLGRVNTGVIRSDHAEILNDYMNGVLINKIANKYDIHPRSISRLVRRYGLKLRRPENNIGRPSNGLKHTVTARLDESMKNELVIYAAKKKQPLANCLRDFIEWGLENDE